MNSIDIKQQQNLKNLILYLANVEDINKSIKFCKAWIIKQPYLVEPYVILSHLYLKQSKFDCSLKAYAWACQVTNNIKTLTQLVYCTICIKNPILVDRTITICFQFLHVRLFDSCIYKLIAWLLELKEIDIQDILNTANFVIPDKVYNRYNQKNQKYSWVRLDGQGGRDVSVERIKFNFDYSLQFKKIKIGSEDARLYKLKNALAWCGGINQSIWSKESQEIIQEISWGTPQIPLFSTTLKNIKPLFLKGNTVFLSVRHAPNYYHWMIDIVSRVFLLKFIYKDLNSFDYFVVDNFCKKFQKEIFRLLEIPDRKIIESSKNPFLEFEYLISPSPFVSFSQKAVKLIASQFRETLIEKKSQLEQNYDKIYIAILSHLWQRFIRI